MRDLELIYQRKWIVEYVYYLSERERNNITDTSRLEDLIFGRIARYIKGDERKLNHSNIIKKLANQVVKQVRDDYKNESYELFEEISTKNNEGEEIEFEPMDVLADVESEIIAKEMTALLAQGDHRKKVILGSWMDGNDNNSEISRLLAQSVGGNTESHRKYIQRFRNDCYEYCANHFVAV